MFIATKVVARESNSRSGTPGTASFERSLERLKTRRVDLLQIHNLNGVAVLIPLMPEWEEGGKIRYVGVNTSRLRQHAEIVDGVGHDPLGFNPGEYWNTHHGARNGIFSAV